MTSVAVWVAADDRGPSSLNIATDSRISWVSTRSTLTWDQAKKVFASGTRPLVVGFLGDVQFPSLTLPSVIDRIDRQVFDDNATVTDIVVTSLHRLWADFPDLHRRFQKIFIGERRGEKMDSEFHLTVMSHAGAPNSRWTTKTVPVPDESTVLVVDGSGRPSILNALSLWDESEAQGTSRAFFSAFVESVASGADPLSGGTPQLGSIYRIGNGRLLGIVHDNQRYFAGAHLIGTENSDGIEWRNDLFEVTDGMRKKRAQGAQRHQPR